MAVIGDENAGRAPANPQMDGAAHARASPFAANYLPQGTCCSSAAGDDLPGLRWHGLPEGPATNGAGPKNLSCSLQGMSWQRPNQEAAVKQHLTWRRLFAKGLPAAPPCQSRQRRLPGSAGEQKFDTCGSRPSMKFPAHAPPRARKRVLQWMHQTVAQQGPGGISRDYPLSECSK